MRPRPPSQYNICIINIYNTYIIHIYNIYICNTYTHIYAQRISHFKYNQRSCPLVVRRENAALRCLHGVVITFIVNLKVDNSVKAVQRWRSPKTNKKKSRSFLNLTTLFMTSCNRNLKKTKRRKRLKRENKTRDVSQSPASPSWSSVLFTRLLSIALQLHPSPFVTPWLVGRKGAWPISSASTIFPFSPRVTTAATSAEGSAGMTSPPPRWTAWERGRGQRKRAGHSVKCTVHTYMSTNGCPGH